MKKMQIQHCEFPDDLYYDVEADVWVKPLTARENRIGMTSILSAIAGRFKTVQLKKEREIVSRGDLIGTVESSKYHGAIRSPINGRVLEFNSRVELEPRLVNDHPYSEGWIARIECADGLFRQEMLLGGDAGKKLESRISELRVKCFKKVPDDELFAVGTECLTTLVSLGEIMKARPVGNIVHLVTDNPAASAELGIWAELTKNLIVESRDEGNLHHFLVEKTSTR